MLARQIVIAGAVLWAACGDNIDTKVGDGKHFNLVLENQTIAGDVADMHYCVRLEAPTDGKQLVRRMEPLLQGDSEAIFRFTILRDPTQDGALDEPWLCPSFPTGAQYVFAWAPGVSPVSFEDGGIPIEQGDRFIVRMHFFNPSQTSVTAGGGVRVTYSQPGDDERKYGMFSPGPVIIDVPPGATSNVAIGMCEMDEALTVVSTLPWMHESGQAFHIDGTVDGQEQRLLEVPRWSSGEQEYLDTVVDLAPGDIVNTSCTFGNPGDDSIHFGETRADTRCFALMYTTPPPRLRLCDAAVPRLPPYTPGECADENPPFPSPRVVSVGIQLGDPADEFTGGAIESGAWELVDSTLFVPLSAALLFNLDRTQVQAQGQAVVDGDMLWLDAQLLATVVTILGSETSVEIPISVAGTFELGSEQGQLMIEPTCGGEEPIAIQYQIDGSTVRILFTQTIALGGNNISLQTILVLESE